MRKMMIALALTEGVTHLALYGCHYSNDSEYAIQRGCAEYWCGVAEGRGVTVCIPPTCDLLNFPEELPENWNCTARRLNVWGAVLRMLR